MVCGLNTNAENSVCDELYVCDGVEAGRQYLYMYMQVRVPVQKEATGHVMLPPVALCLMCHKAISQNQKPISGLGLLAR